MRAVVSLMIKLFLERPIRLGYAFSLVFSLAGCCRLPYPSMNTFFARSEHLGTYESDEDCVMMSVGVGAHTETEPTTHFHWGRFSKISYKNPEKQMRARARSCTSEARDVCIRVIRIHFRYHIASSLFTHYTLLLLSSSSFYFVAVAFPLSQINFAVIIIIITNSEINLRDEEVVVAVKIGRCAKKQTYFGCFGDGNGVATPTKIECISRWFI